MDAALDLMRRLPPSKATENLSALRELLPDAQEALLGKVDQPLCVKFDEAAHREFVCCEYNRDGDSHRSPWTNSYIPEREGGFVPESSLRELEVQANEVLNEYRRMYYGGGTSSAYLWSSGNAFAGCFVIKKEIEGEEVACWDAIHLVDVEKKEGEGGYAYQLCTTLILTAAASMAAYGKGKFAIDGTIYRTARQTCPLGEGHITNIGRLIEKTESNIRNMLGEVYIGKTRDVLHVLREPEEQIRHRGM